MKGKGGLGDLQAAIKGRMLLAQDYADFYLRSVDDLIHALRAK
jgi:hypothetical protein